MLHVRHTSGVGRAWPRECHKVLRHCVTSLSRLGRLTEPCQPNSRQTRL